MERELPLCYVTNSGATNRTSQCGGATAKCPGDCIAPRLTAAVVASLSHSSQGSICADVAKLLGVI